MAELSGEQRHRAAGVLLTMAAGGALGASYEFGGPYPADMPVAMKGGGAFNWAPGEWTDDTQMALVIAQAAVETGDMLSTEALDHIARGWAQWTATAADVGAQTSSVLSAAKRAAAADAATSVSAAHLAAASEDLHMRTGHTAGNGSLMRTAPVALAYLHDPDALTQAATGISQLTHFDLEAAEACVLWCHLIRLAVLTGELRAVEALEALAVDRRAVWAERLDSPASMQPSDFTSNGWVVQALHAAWCSIVTTAGDAASEADSSTSTKGDLGLSSPSAPQDPRHVRRALEAAVRGGRDTDTVAAIAGGLLGGLYATRRCPPSGVGCCMVGLVCVVVT